MPVLPFLGANNCLPLFHLDKRLIRIEETGERINEFEILYMIDPRLHFNEAFRDQVETFMNATFVELTQSFIKSTL